MEAVQTLTDEVPQAIAYFGWYRYPCQEGVYDVIGYQHTQVVLPLDPERGDYDYLLGRAQRTIMSIHGAAAYEAGRAVNWVRA